MKTTLITGVCGTTGSEILKQLYNLDIEVRSGRRKVIGIDNLFRGTVKNLGEFLHRSNFTFVQMKFQDYIRDIDTTEIDEIYHMAAVVPTKYFYEAPELTFEENCLGTIELFNWARRVGVKRFIVGSTSEVYGHIKDTDLPANELTMSHFDSVGTTPRWSYAEGKLLTEHYLNHFKDEMERICHLRFANTYGPSDVDNNHIIPYIVNRVLRKEEIHLNEKANMRYRTFLHSTDAAEACIRLMYKGQNGEAYNVGSTEEISIEMLTRKILKISKEFYGIDTSGIKIIKDIVRTGDPKRRVLDCTKLINDTGFKPHVSLDEGIKTVIWYCIKNKEADQVW